MAVNDYASLKAAAETYMVHDDISAATDTLIGLAEVRLNDEFRLLSMQSMQEYTDVSTQRITLPDDYAERITFYQKGVPGGPLDYMPPDLFWSMKDSREGAGFPHTYTVEGDEIVLAPAPDSGRDYVLSYYVEVVGLSPTNPTNAILAASPTAYLWETLRQAALLVDSDELEAKYERNYMNALATVMAADKRARARPIGRMRSPYVRDGTWKYA